MTTTKPLPSVLTPEEVVAFDRAEQEKAKLPDPVWYDDGYDDVDFYRAFNNVYSKQNQQRRLYEDDYDPYAFDGPWPKKAEGDEEIIPGRPYNSWQPEEVQYLANEFWAFDIDETEARAILAEAVAYVRILPDEKFTRTLVEDTIEDKMMRETYGWRSL